MADREQARSPVRCEDGDLHDLQYMGSNRKEGRKIRSGMYRCNTCGEYITKQALKEATDYA